MTRLNGRVMCLGDPLTAMAMWTLGLVVSTDLPAIATAFLVVGMDSSSLRVLAGIGPADAGDAEALWTAALRELAVEVPDRRAAATVYARCVSRLILSGDIKPYEGSRTLWEASVAVGDPSFHELDPFIYAASEYEDRPADRPWLEEAIIQEAQRWAAT